MSEENTIEQPTVLPDANRVQTMVADRATTLAKEGYDIIRKCGDLVNDIMKLNALEGMEGVKFTGRLAELTGEQAKADLSLFMQAIIGISTQLEANGSEQSKGLARLSVYAA